MQQNLPDSMISELRTLLVYNCHRVAKAREVASVYLNQLISSFPSFMCDASLVYAILEVITILRRSCEGEFTDEVSSINDSGNHRISIRLMFSMTQYLNLNQNFAV